MRENIIQVGDWRAVRATGELTSAAGTERLEPKVMDLLFLLAGRPGDAFSKDEIMASLWPNVVVGDDTLARAVSRLRKALADDTKTPRYIETLPKRGYRLIAAVQSAAAVAAPQPPASAPPMRNWMLPAMAAGVALVAVLVVFVSSSQAPKSADAPSATLVERANDFYFQYKRADNEAAIELFNRILAENPDYAPALAGLANAFVQKVIRWPDDPGTPEYTKLGDALKAGRTNTTSAVQLLARAQTFAERAVRIAPDDPAALKALGFVQSAKGDFASAIASYKRAIARDKDAWGPLINIGDVLEISGKPREALPYFEAAYAAMARIYDSQSARVRPWHAELGVLIGDRYKTFGNASEAEAWYRRVLANAPLHAGATSRLAALLREHGDPKEAADLCANLRNHADAGCGGN